LSKQAGSPEPAEARSARPARSGARLQTPMLVLPDDTPAHAYQTAVDIASLAPNAEVMVYLWKDPPELKAGPSIACGRS